MTAMRTVYGNAQTGSRKLNGTATGLAETFEIFTVVHWLNTRRAGPIKEKRAMFAHDPVTEFQWNRLGRALRRPVPQLDVFFYLAALIAMFLGFGRPIVGLTKRRFWIANDFSDGVYRFAHTYWFPFVE